MKNLLKTVLAIMVIWYVFTAENVSTETIFLYAISIILTSLLIINYEEVKEWLTGNAY